MAAAEAAEEDQSFAPDVVRPAAAKLFMDIQSAWDSADRVARAARAPDLLAEWERRLDDFDRHGGATGSSRWASRRSSTSG